MKQIVYLLIFLCFAFAKAQSLSDLIPKVEEQPRKIVDTLNRDYDDRVITSRDFPATLKEEYTGAEYDYVEEITERSQSSVGRLIGRFFDWLGDVFGFTITPFWKDFFTYFTYFLVGLAVLYFIIRMLTDESPAKLFSRSQREIGTVNIEETHIEELDLKKYINDSVAAGNYRNAIRYLYLDSLKSLSASKKIEWDFQKTNSDYYRELKDPDVREQFKKVSYVYDYVWYGEFAIDQETFNSARTQFEILDKKAA